MKWFRTWWLKLHCKLYHHLMFYHDQFDGEYNYISTKYYCWDCSQVEENISEGEE